ncbi:uncharacterized protein LOC132036209 [Lycium ferocissimum]|uniref:uncharacterized protein LOC132036209 n=1 Tax=Lycium ferocissimum TaxID=112874 RepID=UPI002815FA55|nr:uncharacterized protein LOC132036209 [Lycium ferocissimum]
MDLDSTRPHSNTSTTTSELFICFTSRLSLTSSSSSMKFSKSILSPGRARDAPLSLPISLSRRLKSNGSIKGGHGQASPMFSTTNKKRGSGFENPEPTSPKVTCIGQVRVKTKKKVKQSRSLSKRRSGSGSGEVSFRKIEQVSTEAFNQTHDRLSLRNSSVHYQQQECVNHRNQRWVHLPLTICEALRAFGAEFSCLFPCRSSCFSTNEGEKVEKRGEAYRECDNINEQRSCGAVFARWLVALQDGEAGKRRDIELVVASGDQEEERNEAMHSTRRHVFEDIELDEIVEMEKGRVSICVPPKNALLLMRCRSDPLKMADLTNRFRESPVLKDEHYDDEDEEEEEDFEENKDVEVVDSQKCEPSKDVKVPDETSVSVDLDEIEEIPEETEVMEMEGKLETCELAAQIEQEETKIESFVAEIESQMEENEDIEDNQVRELEEGEGEEMSILSHSSLLENSDTGTIQIEDEEVVELVTEEASLEEEEERFKSTIMKEIQEILLGSSDQIESSLCQSMNMPHPAVQGVGQIRVEALPRKSEDFWEDSRMGTQQESEYEEQEEDTPFTEPVQNEDQNKEGKQSEVEYPKEPEKEEKESVLPDCLLLMMCEPKLSMEVSKETWVCRRDFLRWLPERKSQQVKPPLKKEIIPEEQPKRRRSTDTRPPMEHRNKQLLQPPRSSCSLPAVGGMSMATMIEQKLVNAAAYEPCVLTRCKSEPMRTAAAKLTPENCCWKNRKIEPHRPATFGVGAAGVGF